MPDYAIYSQATGDIEKVVSCPPGMLSLQYDPEVSGAVEVDGMLINENKVVNGEPVYQPPDPPTPPVC